MQIHLSEVLSGENKTIQAQIPLELAQFPYQSESYPIVSKKPIELTVTHVGKKEITIRAKADVVIQIPCDRCLADVDTEFHLDIQRGVDLNLTEEDRRNELDECSYLDGLQLDVDRLVFDEILLNWPMKVLCREDCRGICKRCGQNLNEGSCDCDQTELDPRMAKIIDIFQNSKE